jgi:hypothetical protein
MYAKRKTFIVNFLNYDISKKIMWECREMQEVGELATVANF